MARVRRPSLTVGQPSITFPPQMGKPASSHIHTRSARSEQLSPHIDFPAFSVDWEQWLSNGLPGLVLSLLGLAAMGFDTFFAPPEVS